MSIPDPFYADLSRELALSAREAARDEETERRTEAMLALGGKYDLADADNIQEAICEAPQEFWHTVAKLRPAPAAVGVLCETRVRSYWYKRAKDAAEEELEAEAQPAEQVSRDE